MSSFIGSALHVNQALTQYAIAWKPPATRADWFARADFFGNVPVSKASDIVRSVSQGRMLQIYDATVSDDGKPGGGLVQFGIGPNVQFQCKPYVLEGAINEYQRRQADDALQYDKNQMAAPRWALEMYLEKQAMATLLNTSNYGNNVTTLAANEYWDDYGSSASLVYDQIATALEKIVLDTGQKVNSAGFSFPVWRVVKAHPGLLRRPFFNQAGPAGYRMSVSDFEQLFGEWMEPGSLKIYRGWYNDVAAPNDDTKNGKLFFGPGAIFAYVQKTPDLEDLSFAKQFVFSGLDGNDPLVVMEMQDNTILPMGGTRIRIMASADYRVMHSESGWIFPTVVDTSSASYHNQAGNSWFA